MPGILLGILQQTKYNKFLHLWNLHSSKVRQTINNHICDKEEESNNKTRFMGDAIFRG